MAPRIVVLEDNALFRFMLEYKLEERYNAKVYSYSTCSDLSKSFSCLAGVDVFVLDYRLNTETVEALLQELLVQFKSVPVFVFSTCQDISVAVELIKMGVTNFILKKDDLDNLYWELDKLHL